MELLKSVGGPKGRLAVMTVAAGLLTTSAYASYCNPMYAECPNGIGDYVNACCADMSSPWVACVCNSWDSEPWPYGTYSDCGNYDYGCYC